MNKGLRELEDSLQKEHEKNALAFAKSKCPKYFKNVESIEVVTKKSFNRVFLKKKIKESNLFVIKSKDFIIYSVFTKDKEPIKVYYNDKYVPNISEILTIDEYDFAKLPFIDIEDRYERAIECSNFWSQLELFIFIYASQMLNCPKRSEKPVKLKSIKFLFYPY